MKEIIRNLLQVYISSKKLLDNMNDGFKQATLLKLIPQNVVVYYWFGYVFEK